MIWLCCHVGGDHLRPETVGALINFASDDDIVIANVSGGDDAYGDELSAMWESCKREFWDLAIVEPDIVIRRDVAAAFRDCEEDYCCFPYAWTTDVGPALGCTRFRWQFILHHENAMERALLEPAGHGAGHYLSIDVALMRYVFARNGIQPHVHLPQVVHLNHKQRLVEGASSEPLMEVPSW